MFRYEHIRFRELTDGKSNQFSLTIHVDDTLFIKSIFIIILLIELYVQNTGQGRDRFLLVDTFNLYANDNTED